MAKAFDYCNSLLSGILLIVEETSQFRNAASMIILRRPRIDHVTSLRVSLALCSQSSKAVWFTAKYNKQFHTSQSDSNPKYLSTSLTGALLLETCASDQTHAFSTL